jgi:putative ABC transport system substrate-binding protein
MSALSSEPFSDTRKPVVSRVEPSAIQKLKSLGFAAFAIAFTVWGAAAQAQSSAKLAKIGFLSSGYGEGSSGWRGSFVREFGKLGYVEGKNVAFEFRNANTKYDRLPALAEELVRLKVDVIVTPGANDTRAAKNATKTIPIVFTGAGSDPVTLGLVESLARPGGNVTGFAQIHAQLAGKRLELLKETVPKLSRVAVLWDPQNAGSKEIWEENQRQAKGLGLQLHSLGINSAAELEGGFKDAVKAGSGALAWTSGALLGSVAKQTINLAAKNRLPAIYHRQVYVADGGLMSYGPDEVEPYQRTALMVDKILKGGKPADIPVEQPTKFELAINLKTAKALGLTIPPVVLMRANRVIK